MHLAIIMLNCQTFLYNYLASDLHPSKSPFIKGRLSGDN